MYKVVSRMRLTHSPVLVAYAYGCWVHSWSIIISLNSDWHECFTVINIKYLHIQIQRVYLHDQISLVILPNRSSKLRLVHFRSVFEQTPQTGHFVRVRHHELFFEFIGPVNEGGALLVFQKANEEFPKIGLDSSFHFLVLHPTFPASVSRWPAIILLVFKTIRVPLTSCLFAACVWMT